MASNKNEVGMFGPIYRQFKNEPKKAIKFLRKVKKGECKDALYRPETGYVDIVWGNGGKDGFGLCHIIDEHEAEIKQLGFEVEDFIPIIFSIGIFSDNDEEQKIKLRGENYMLIIKTKWNNVDKKFLLSAFDLRPISKKNPKRISKLKKGK